MANEAEIKLRTIVRGVLERLEGDLIDCCREFHLLPQRLTEAGPREFQGKTAMPQAMTDASGSGEDPHRCPINAKPYKETLNLPVTRFEMKANLTVREPKIQARWREQDLYGQIRQARAGRDRKVLHDGPPYANGEIHMGHLLNKVLKDLVVRSLTMRGFDSPYVPGWDCHGLPIEHKVVKDLGSKAAGMSHAEIRKLCHAEAMKWVEIQRDQFRRLGVWATGTVPT